MNCQFVHLRTHTEFSLLDGLLRIKPLVNKVAELGMPAVGVTDQTNFYGLVKFYKAAIASGIKPLFGCDFFVLDEEDEDHQPYLLTLFAQNQQGYRNIIELISKAYQQGQRQGIAHIYRHWLGDYCQGVIALSGAKQGDIGRALVADNTQLADQRLQQWCALFPGRFYLEVQRTGRDQDERYLHAVVTLSERGACPVVATNDVRFMAQSDYEAHEARVCIYEGRTLDDPRRARLYSDQQYLKTPAEMLELFSDIPEALQNSIEIAKRCSVPLTLGDYQLPDYPVPAGMTMDAFFRQQSQEGLQERLAVLFDTESSDFADKEKIYQQRLEFELNIIIQMGFPGYFLIVMDFIQWAKDHDIPVGPGRGSGAGSLVAYVLKITDLDPIEYDLLFERFLNPERVSMPDFDVDFCMDNRDRVINYVAENYGRDAVSQIITFGTMAAKAVVRDVARVQGKSYGLADKLSKMIPFEVGITLEKACEQEEPLRDFLAEDGDAQEIWDMAKQLEGITRNVGKHAGGVVIAPTKLTDFAPLYCDETGGGLVTQFDKGDVEDAGLVKFDFLGLRTLTIIDWAIKIINGQRQLSGESALSVMSIPLVDKATFDLLQAATTTAVFQLESRGMKDLIKRLRPDCFEDIIALVALFRPGPLQSGMVDNFINRKHGREAIAYPDHQYQHESLKPILEPTYGIILYQEQVMQIAQELAGYTLGGADMLRRAMGKKKPEEMAKQRDVFESGAVGKGVDGELAIKIFDLVEKFAGYGFNKSHSAAYALVSYQTAWLKTHYPAPFMAATMSSELQNTDKIVIFIEECRAIKLELRSPDVNEGEYMFTVNDKGEIVYGLGAIKGLGEGPIESMITARQNAGPFRNLFDFCERTDSRKLNKRALEALIRAGAFDSLGEERSILMASMNEAMKAAEQTAKNQDCGISDLFGSVVPSTEEHDVYTDFRQVHLWSGRERLAGEKETLGLYLTGHPIDDYEKEIRLFSRSRIVDLKADKNTQAVTGLIVGMRTVKTKRGDMMAILTLDDRSARLEVTIFSDLYLANRDKLVKDAIVVLEGEVRYDDYSGGLKMTTKTVMSLVEARQRYARELLITVNDRQFSPGFEAQFAALLAPHQEEGCPVRVKYEHDEYRVALLLADKWRVSPSDELLTRLKDCFGQGNVALNYTR